MSKGALVRCGFVVLAVVAVCGCRLKSVEAYKASKAESRPTGFKDPYTYGGNADSSGGLKTTTRIGSGLPASGR